MLPLPCCKNERVTRTRHELLASRRLHVSECARPRTRLPPVHRYIGGGKDMMFCSVSSRLVVSCHRRSVYQCRMFEASYQAKSSAIWIRLYRKPDSESNLLHTTHISLAELPNDTTQRINIKTVILTSQSSHPPSPSAPPANSAHTSHAHPPHSAYSAECTPAALAPPANHTARSGTAGYP